MPQQIGRRAAPRLQGLDALRGIAALTVVLYHFTLGYQDVLRQHRLGLLFVVSNGHFAVNLFFIISGFVIFMTLESSAGAADFAVSRFARLWPPYMACAALTGSVILFQHFNPLKLTVRDALLNALMMNRALAIVSIDPSYWTLTFEVLFYAGAAVTFFVLRVRRMEWACLAWLGVALAAKVSGFDAHHARFGVILDADYCQFFVLGMMIYLIAKRRATRLTMSTALLAYAMNLFGPSNNPGNVTLCCFMVMTAVFGLTVWLIAETRLRFLNVWPLLFLGEISYSLYLVHQIAGYWIIEKLEGRGWNPNIAILAAILCAIAAAACVRRGVELPAQKAIRGWYREKGKYYLSSPSRTFVPANSAPMVPMEGSGPQSS